MNKELEALEVLKLLKDFLNGIELGNVDKLYVGGSLNIIKAALEALEIIKNKKVDVWYEIMLSVSYDNYLDTKTDLSEELTEEEFNLLKEVLK